MCIHLPQNPMKVERYYPHFAKEKQGEGMLKDRFLVLYLGSFETF